MLKTNSKKVMEAMKKEVLSFYNLEDLKNDLKAVRCPNQCNTIYHCGCRLVESGCFRVYNNDINGFLLDVLEETEEEADKYFDKSFDLYKHLIAKAIEKLVK